MVVPRYRRDRQSTKQRGVNLVASWHGQTRLFAGCGERATTAICSTPDKYLASNHSIGRKQTPKGSCSRHRLAEM
jgi:hypothetical protein